MKHVGAVWASALVVGLVVAGCAADTREVFGDNSGTVGEAGSAGGGTGGSTSASSTTSEGGATGSSTSTDKYMADECSKACPAMVNTWWGDCTVQDVCTKMFQNTMSSPFCSQKVDCPRPSVLCEKLNFGDPIFCCPGEGPDLPACTEDVQDETDQVQCDANYGKNTTTAHTVHVSLCQAPASWGKCYFLSPSAFCCES